MYNKLFNERYMKRSILTLALLTTPLNCIFAGQAGELIIPFIAKKRNPKPSHNQLQQKSNGLIKGDKQTMIAKAQECQKKAKENLDFCNSHSWAIPDLSDRQHFKVLVTSLLASLGLSGMKTKVYAVGIPLLYSIVDLSIDNFFNMRTRLLQAVSDDEMYKFYMDLSTKLPISAGYNDPGTEFYAYAINNLTYAEMYANAYQSEGFKELCFHRITEVRNKIIDYVENPYRGANVHEWVEELTTTLSNDSGIKNPRMDNNLFDQMHYHLRGCLDCILMAEAIWGI